MTQARRIVMRMFLRNCDDKYMELCYYMGHGAFDDMVMDHVMTRGMEHCDESGHGSL